MSSWTHFPCPGGAFKKGGAAAGDTVLTCANPADVAEKFIGAPEGLKFAANEAGTAVVLAAKPTIVIPKVDEVELSEASQAVLVAAAEAAGLTSVTAVTGKTTVNGAETPLTAAQIDNVLALFNNVVTAEGTTLKVDYNFGIEAIKPSYNAGSITMFTVKVKVARADGTLATLADGATLVLVDGATGTTLRDAGAGFSASTDNDGTYDGYFFASDSADYDGLIGRSFKVKATK